MGNAVAMPAQASSVPRHAVEAAHIHGVRTLLVGKQGLVHFLPGTHTDDADILLVTAEQLADGVGLGANGTGGSLLHQDIAALAVLEGEQNQVYGLIQGHDKAGHGTVGDGDGVPCAELVDPQGDDRATGAHNVAVAGTNDLGLIGGNDSGFGHGDLLHHGLGDAHGADGVGGLVGGQANDALYPRLNGGIQHVLGAQNVGLHGLHGKEFTGGYLLEGGSMEHEIHAVHGVLHRSGISDVADIELDFVCHVWHFRRKFVAHLVLQRLVAGQHADLSNIRGKETGKSGAAEGACSAGDEQGFVGKPGHSTSHIVFCKKALGGYIFFIIAPSGRIVKGNRQKGRGLRLCKISGKIEFSHHIFVVAFSYAGNKEEAPRKAGRCLQIGKLFFDIYIAWCILNHFKYYIIVIKISQIRVTECFISTLGNIG